MYIKNIYLIIINVCLVLCLVLSCFGPFYTQLATYYVTDQKSDLVVEFNGYQLEIHIGAAKENNREPLELFSTGIYAKSINKYSQPTKDIIDTLNTIKIDQMCIYTYINDSVQCPLPYLDTAYIIFKNSNRIIQQLKWGWYEYVYIPKENDSIKMTFTAVLYDDNSYTKILDQQEYSTVLYRKYRKTIPISR